MGTVNCKVMRMIFSDLNPELAEKANRIDEPKPVERLASQKVQVLQELLNESMQKCSSTETACNQLESRLREKSENIKQLETHVGRMKDAGKPCVRPSPQYFIATNSMIASNGSCV